MERGEGERLYAEQRKRFWRIMGGLLLLGFVTGIIASFVMRRADAGSDFPFMGASARHSWRGACRRGNGLRKLAVLRHR
jgi:hypothetical protein